MIETLKAQMKHFRQMDRTSKRFIRREILQTARNHSLGAME